MRIIRFVLTIVFVFVVLFLTACANGGGNQPPDRPPDQPPPPVAPTATLSSSAWGIVLGESVTLTWTCSNASSCNAAGNWSGPKALSGSQMVTPPMFGQNSYDLNCTGPRGSVTTSQVGRAHVG